MDMGRAIGGAVVGMISWFFAAVVLSVVIAFILGAEGVIDLGTKEPLMAWIVIGLVVGGIASFLSGAVARAIGKAPLAVYIIMGLVVVLTIVSFFGGEPNPDQLEALESADMNAFIAMSYAQMNTPAWSMYVSPVVSLLCLAWGGLKASDFGSTTPVSSTVDIS